MSAAIARHSSTAHSIHACVCVCVCVAFGRASDEERVFPLFSIIGPAAHWRKFLSCFAVAKIRTLTLMVRFHPGPHCFPWIAFFPLVFIASSSGVADCLACCGWRRLSMPFHTHTTYNILIYIYICGINYASFPSCHIESS